MSTAGEWLRGEGPHHQIVISSRVRLARNLRNRSFPGWAKKAERTAILELIKPRVEELPEMQDAQKLFNAVKHLKPTILTGLPLGTWAAPQKERWAATHFPGVPIITTMARQKHLHMDPGDVLVDDRENHRHLWDKAGGIFIHHKNAADSIRRLAKIYPSVKLEAEA